jgi:GMP synthase-like glutamine amidotransferase
MVSLHVLQHVPMEGPGRIARVAEALGVAVRVHALYDGVPVPPSLPRGDALAVMGGSMGVGDLGDPRWPFLADEVELLKRWLPAGGATLGVCLGSQLMAHALGANVFPLTVGNPALRHREVGWGAITFVVPTGTEPALAGLDESEVVLHWHGDTFDLPDGAVRLASTLPCQNQMFRWGRRAYGLQFHVEVTADEVRTWARDDGDFVRAASGPLGVERLVADTDRYMARHVRVGDRLIRNILAELLSPA